MARRQEYWQRLEALLGRMRDRIPLGPMELDELGRLYQMVSSDLALAQRDFPDEEVTLYLNRLVGQAHAAIYQVESFTWQSILRFYRETFPRLYRVLLPYTRAAVLLFLLPALAAFLAVWQDPERIYVLMGQGIRPLVEQVERGRMWTDIPLAFRSTASVGIFANNIRVMVFTFAGGVTGGLLTVYVMVVNGVNLGALFGLLQAHGMSGRLAEFVVAHGVIELSVIFLVGGCGLYMGDALWRPGLQSRRVALAQRARTAVQVVLGCAPLLVVAGLIEGFISPSGLPWPLKAGVGAVSGLLLYRYWLGRWILLGALGALLRRPWVPSVGPGLGSRLRG